MEYEDISNDYECEREDSSELDDSFEWPEEDEPESSRQMEKSDEKRVQWERERSKAAVSFLRSFCETVETLLFYQEEGQPPAKKMKITPVVQVPNILTVYACKRDLRYGLRAAGNIKLWRLYSDSLVQILQRRLSPQFQAVYFEMTDFYSTRSFNQHSELHLEIKVQHITGPLFRVVNVNEIEKTCLEENYASLGLKSSEETSRSRRQKRNDGCQ